MRTWTDLAGLNDSFKASRILHAACEHRLFDHLERPAPAEAVAAASRVDPRGARIVLDAMVVLGLVRKTKDHYGNTALAKRFLVTTSPDYYGDMVRFDSMNWHSWGELPDALRTGRPVRRPMFQDDPWETERFMRAMVSVGVSRGDAKILPERVKLAGRTHLVDVGGGPGHFTRAFLKADPRLRATIFDLPGTLKVTEKLVGDWGKEKDRLTLRPGDYLKDALPDCDAALVSNILHGEPPERCQRLLQHVAKALAPGGVLVIKDHVRGPAGVDDGLAALFAVDMLLHTGGDCYDLATVSRWLKDAGFAQVKEQKPRAPLTSSLVTAVKA